MTAVVVNAKVLLLMLTQWQSHRGAVKCKAAEWNSVIVYCIAYSGAFPVIMASVEKRL